MRDKFIEIQKAKLLHGQIDRRQFVMSVLAAGVALPAALGFADKAYAATPKRGGLFRMVDIAPLPTCVVALNPIVLLLLSPS